MTGSWVGEGLQPGPYTPAGVGDAPRAQNAHKTEQRISCAYMRLGHTVTRRAGPFVLAGLEGHMAAN